MEKKQVTEKVKSRKFKLGIREFFNNLISGEEEQQQDVVQTIETSDLSKKDREALLKALKVTEAFAEDMYHFDPMEKTKKKIQNKMQEKISTNIKVEEQKDKPEIAKESMERDRD